MGSARSANPVACFDISTPEFCTRPRWSCDGESAWSILHKFQWLNRLPLNALLSTIGRTDLADADPSLDLRFASMLDVETSSSNLGISSARILHSFVSIQNQALARALFSNGLRYCPQCLTRGFHAILHQCLLLNRCPIHYERLQATCPQCRRKIAYRLNSSAASHPYACPNCDIPLAPCIDASCGRPSLPTADRIGALFHWQQWVKEHSDNLSVPPRLFGTTNASLHASMLARLKFMKDFQTAFADFPVQTLRNHQASRRLANCWLDTPNGNHPVKRLNYLRHEWTGFRGVYIRLESDYESAVDRIRQRREIIGSITRRRQSSKSCSFGLAALTLWCMVWEGTLHPAILDTHGHPAFGIAVWLTLQERTHSNSQHPLQELRRKFRIALEDTLAKAMVLAQAMNSDGTYLFEPRLLLPTIFDCTESQRFTNRTSVTH